MCGPSVDQILGFFNKFCFSLIMIGPNFLNKSVKIFKSLVLGVWMRKGGSVRAMKWDHCKDVE